MSNYSEAWKRGDVQAEIRAKADHKCEHCGIAFHEGTNIAIKAKNKLGNPIIGTCHHITGDTSDDSYYNVVFLCQRCHLHVQALWKPNWCIPQDWDGVPDWIKKRQLVHAVQIELF